ncbi:ATP-dependent zinc metalloprotease FtsH [bacterium]|nr:ATP-dependent metallopeptidase FtsH/Yme1/Tma family protein [Candidatus Omnitrophota bacterium]MBU2527777.1 ATP-dependent zinc metalloprotease FtsH [bacterium]MBU3930423.1 ATP-dependent zinc metalloprotease FtsH [bacterium]MBU4123274.1 ATP-dependent zinc metalloprotease FtsH [bacterium]
MKKRNVGLSFWVLLAAIVLYLNYSQTTKVSDEQISYNKFRTLLEAGKIISVEIVKDETIKGDYRADGKSVSFKTPYLDDKDLIKDMQANGVDYAGKTGGKWLGNLLFSFGPILLFILAWFIFATKMSGGSKQIFSFGKSRAQNAVKVETTFADVAGCDEVKDELVEVISFLKNPEKFQKLGGRIPKGVILYGEPGTGKTLLARAIAGEAKVPFFSASGSEFVEMFVGVGASRVRDLFQMAKASAPAVIFVDEIDAVGRHRGAGLGGGHDEREQTLNQLLVGMDGFEPNTNVIVIAATNRPDILDPALLRPGRFDRHIHIPKPNIKEREDILDVHAKKIKMNKDINLEIVARRTPGFVGSDLANIINESALLAARKNKESVEMIDLEEAIDRVLAGPEKKSRVMRDSEKKIICYHESGHALVAKLMPDGDTVHKVSIIPRGPALGYTLQLPLEDRFIASKDELINKIKTLLGGRAAEKIIFKQLSTGASNDLEKATEIAHSMVTQYGMSSRVGPAVFKDSQESVFLGMDISKGSRVSEKMKQIIDEEIRNIIIKAERDAENALTKNRKYLDAIAEELEKREMLNAEDLDKIMKGEELAPLASPPAKSENAAPEMKNSPDETAKETDPETKNNAERIKKDDEQKETV